MFPSIPREYFAIAMNIQKGIDPNKIASIII